MIGYIRVTNILRKLALEAIQTKLYLYTVWTVLSIKLKIQIFFMLVVEVRILRKYETYRLINAATIFTALSYRVFPFGKSNLQFVSLSLAFVLDA